MQMKRQYVESVTCVCLIVYAAIVLIGQAGHWIPGLGCHCHIGNVATHIGTSSRFEELIESPILMNSDTGARQGSISRQPVKHARSIKSDGHCPICNWFVVAQERPQPVLFVVDTAGLFPVGLTNRKVWYLTPVSTFARGPPFELAHS